MEPNSSKIMVWYEDSIVGMVETTTQKKKNNTTEIKEEPTTNVENQSIVFHKALQTLQHLTPNEMTRVMEQSHNTVGPITQPSLQGLGMPRRILIWSYHYNGAMMDESELPKIVCTYLSPIKNNNQDPKGCWYIFILN